MLEINNRVNKTNKFEQGETMAIHGIIINEQNTGGQTLTVEATSVIGIVGTAKNADATVFPINQPVLVTKVEDIASLGTDGTLPNALLGIFKQCSTLVVVVRVEEAETPEVTVTNIAGSLIDKSGVYGLLSAENKVKYKPKILLAPLFDSKVLQDNKANAIVTNLEEVAEKLRAVAVINGTDTTMQDAINYASNLNSARLYMVDPSYIASFSNQINLPSSPIVAGVIARTDAEYGFWYSPSNKVINDVVDTNRTISFNLPDVNCEANLLNQAGVATIVFTSGNFLLWGNRSLSQDIEWQFLSIRRVADAIEDALDSELLNFIDQPLNKTLISIIESNIQHFIDGLIAKGALLGGKVWLDKNANSVADLKQGKATISLDFQPPAPLEQLTINISLNDGYYDEVFK